MLAGAATLPLASQAEVALHPVEGLWGFELADDMTCAANPVSIDLTDNRQQLVFSWPKTVQYSDGTANDGVTFTVVGLDGLRLQLRRDRDGVVASITVAPDGKSFQYEENDPNAGSRFDRCDDLAS
ncbi:hypothetical protein [Tabrizicola thermarum]|uniref:hypothetical protein n=1 Tax=Tabrizicola thermarum TaxID=2670345 RepID=UPI000FFC9911|nr:hypothetical protein [Tabrizicola thermarum]